MKSTVSIALRVVHQTPLNERGGSGFRRHRAAHISSEVHVVHDRTSAAKKGVLTSRSNIVSRVLDTYFFVIVYSIILVRYYHVEFVGFGWTLKGNLLQNKNKTQNKR